MLETGVLKNTQNGVMGHSGFGFVGLHPFFPPPLPTTDLTKVSGKLSGEVPHVDTPNGVEPTALDHRRQPPCQSLSLNYISRALLIVATGLSLNSSKRFRPYSSSIL